MYSFANFRGARVPAAQPPRSCSTIRRSAMSPVEPPYSYESPVMNKANTITIAIGTLLLAACAVGPNYRTPEIEPARVQNAESSAFVVQTPEALWWQQFDDAELDGLVA